MEVIEVETAEELKQLTYSYVSSGWEAERSSNWSYARLKKNGGSSGDILIRVADGKIPKRLEKIAAGKPEKTPKTPKIPYGFGRVVYAKSKAEFYQQVHYLILAGYSRTDSDDENTFIMVKKRKVSGGFCLLWLIFGVIPLFIYLAWVKGSEPLDKVEVKLSN